MRVFLISPPTLYEEQQDSILEPIGLCYLSSVATQAGHEVRIHDLCDTRHANIDQLFAELDAFRPEVVGFTAMSNNFARALDVARAVKARFGCPIIFGGWHVSGKPMCLTDPTIDFVVVGEGEETFVELLQHIATGVPLLPDIPGLGFKLDGQPKINRARDRIMALDVLPPPDRSQLPIHRYKHPVLLNVPTSKMKTLSLQASRGCPYKCSFCQTPAVWGPLWRRRDPGSVADEIESLIQDYGINSLWFRDEEFTINRTWVMSLAQELSRRGIPKVLQWGSFCRVDDIDRELLETLKEAGYCYGFLGIEAGTIKARELLNKQFKQEEAEKALGLFHEYDITSHGGWIMGFPWDTKEGLEEQFSWLRTLPIDLLAISYAMPFDGTQFGEEMKRQGMIQENEGDRYSLRRPILRTPHIPFGELPKIRASFVRRFYFSPRNLARIARRVYLRPERVRILGELVWKLGKTAYFGPDYVSEEFTVPDRYFQPIDPATRTRTAPPLPTIIDDQPEMVLST